MELLKIPWDLQPSHFPTDKRSFKIHIKELKVAFEEQLAEYRENEKFRKKRAKALLANKRQRYANALLEGHGEKKFLG